MFYLIASQASWRDVLLGSCTSVTALGLLHFVNTLQCLFLFFLSYSFNAEEINDMIHFFTIPGYNFICLFIFIHLFILFIYSYWSHVPITRNSCYHWQIIHSFAYSWKWGFRGFKNNKQIESRHSRVAVKMVLKTCQKKKKKKNSSKNSLWK